MTLAPEQFERMAMEQMDLLYRMARRLTGNAAEAEDLVQETYLRAIRGRESYSLESFGIRPWLLRILLNLHTTRAQRNRRQPVQMNDDMLELSEYKGDTDSSLPIDPRSFDGMDQELVRALGNLPEEYRVPLLMWAVEELSYKEIAAVLDIPIGTVMSRLHRARQRLIEQLRGYATRTGFIRE